MSKNPFTIRSIFYNSVINRAKFITNKKKFNVVARTIKPKQNNLSSSSCSSLLKRNYCTNNKKNTNPILPIIAMGGGGGGGGDGGNNGGGNNLFIVFMAFVIGPRIIYDNINQAKN